MAVENWLKHAGKKCLRNGWPIVLLQHNNKFPLKYKWMTTVVTEKHVDSLLSKGKKAGVGILCGNIIGLDDDHELGGAVTETFIKAIEELKDHFFPEYLARRGRKTRQPLRVFKLTDGAVFRSCNIGKFQIIAKGRQFVAYNVHPETDEPYVWLKSGVGTPMGMHLDDVPAYNKEHLEKFIAAVEMLEDAFGLDASSAESVLERIKRGEMERSADELRVERGVIEKAAQYVPNEESWGWEEWNRNIMMPLWSASGGEEWGLELAHKISSKHALYDQAATDARWQEITNSPPSRIGGGTLLWLARKNGMPNLGPRDWDSFHAVLDVKELYSTIQRRWISKETFNDVFADQTQKGLSPYQRFLQSRMEQTYDMMTWDPSLPYGGNTVRSVRVWNTCVLPDDYGEEEDIEPWMELMHSIYEDKDLDIIMKRMAYDVQYPHRKPQWHELIIGQHGIGKNKKQQPVRRWFGEMAATINASEFERDFNSYAAQMKYLEVEELAGIGNKVFNKIKGMLATDDAFLMVNEKFKKPYKARNVLSFWLSTNEVDAVSLSPDERRIYVVEAKRRSLTDRRFSQITAWLDVEKNWKAVVWHLKYKVKVHEQFGQQFNDIMRTDAMMALVDMAGRAHERIGPKIKKIINGASLVNLSDISDNLLEADVMVDKPTIRKALRSLGWSPAYKGQQIRHEGSKRRYWTDDRTLENASEETLRIILDNQSSLHKLETEE